MGHHEGVIRSLRRRIGSPREAVPLCSLALISALMTVSCSTPSAPSASLLIWPNPAGTTSFFATLPNVAAGQPLSLGGIVVCAQGGSGIRVDRVELANAHNLTLQAFAVRRTTIGDPAGGVTLGAEPKTLSEVGFLGAGAPVNVDTHCYPNGRAAHAGEGNWELGLQLSRTTAGTGVETGVIIHYSSAGIAQTLEIPFVVTLCAPRDTTDACGTG